MDMVSFILFVLTGVLLFFIFVRAANYVLRAVDSNQKIEQNALLASGAECSGEAAAATSFEESRVVELGMTADEVEAVLGSPDTKANLGHKVLYRYEGITVEFEDGKVVDVR